MTDPLDDYMASLEAAAKAAPKNQKKAKTLVEEEEEEDLLEREKWDAAKATTMEDGTRLHCFPEQTEVRVRGSDPGLKAYVGKTGRVVDFLDSENIYHVMFEEKEKDEAFISVPPANLQQIVRGVGVENLVGRPELNGLQASVLELAPSGRYQVEICPKKQKGTKKSKTEPVVVALKLDNLLLPAGTRVRIQGLQKTPKYNGKWGMITGLAMSPDQKQVDATRYAVQVSKQSILNLKRENCFP